MIDSDLIQDGGVEVADMHAVADDVVAVVVGLAVLDARFDAAAG